VIFIIHSKASCENTLCICGHINLHFEYSMTNVTISTANRSEWCAITLSMSSGDVQYYHPAASVTRAAIILYNNMTSSAHPLALQAATVNDSFGHNASFSAANVVHNYPATRSDWPTPTRTVFLSVGVACNCMDGTAHAHDASDAMRLWRTTTHPISWVTCVHELVPSSATEQRLWLVLSLTLDIVVRTVE